MLLSIFPQSLNFFLEIPLRSILWATKKLSKRRFELWILLPNVSQKVPRRWKLIIFATASYKTSSLKSKTVFICVSSLSPDPRLVHRIKQIHETHAISVYFPSDSEDSDAVTLIADPTKDIESGTLKEALKNAEEDLKAVVRECGEFSTHKLSIAAKLHKDIRGQNDTTLNV